MKTLLAFIFMYIPRFLYKEGFEDSEEMIATVGSGLVFLAGVVGISLFLKKGSKKGVIITVMACAAILCLCNWHWASIIVWMITLLIGWVSYSSQKTTSS